MSTVQRGKYLLYGIGMILSVAVVQPTTVFGQTYPDKTVQYVTGSTQGGGGDFAARLVAQALSDRWGQPVVVENMPGASQSIAAAHVATQPADGYTLLALTSSVLATALVTDLPYNLEEDLEPLALVAISPVLLVVNSSVPANNLEELIALARSKPGELSYGSAGIGSTPHLAGELFNMMAGVDIQHVPYKGGALATTAVAGGEVQVNYAGIVAAQPLIDAGEIRPLAVSSAERSSAIPDVPTMAEAGVPGYDYVSWYGVFAPAGLPDEVKAKLQDDLADVMSDPSVTKALADQGLEPQNMLGPEFGEKVSKDLKQFKTLAERIGLEPDL